MGAGERKVATVPGTRLRQPYLEDQGSPLGRAGGET